MGSESIHSKLSMIDVALERVGAPHLRQNVHFAEDELSHPLYVRGTLYVEERRSAKITMAVSPEGLEIGIEDVVEAIEWSDDYIFSNEDHVIDVLVNVLSCHILLERYGSVRTDILLFDVSGSPIHHFIYRKGIVLSKNRQFHLFFPAYPSGTSGLSI